MTYEISPQELMQKMDHEGLHIIDVREDYEVQMGMLKGARHIPMNTIPDHMPEFKQDEPYYIVCAHGIRSEKVTEYLRDHDIEAFNVTGGMAAF